MSMPPALESDNAVPELVIAYASTAPRGHVFPGRR